jgi:hypothetical protein
MKKLTNTIAHSVKEMGTWFLAQPEEELSKRPAPGKWSKKEIIGHLCDSAMNNIQRFVRGQYETNPQIGYEQDNWVSFGNYNSYTKEEVITLWTSLNKHLCKVLDSMPEEKYNNTSVMKAFGDTVGTFTLVWIAEDYLRHMEHHLKVLVG